MKTSLYGLLIAVCFGQATFRFHCQAQPSFLTNGLVGYYPFDANGNDLSGQNNHGSVNGATPTTNRFGLANSAYSFAGNGATYISIPDSPSLDITNAVTVTAWIRTKGGGTFGPRIVSKRVYQLDLSDTTSSPHLVFSLDGPVNAISPPISLADNQWLFVAGSFDGLALRVYTNGLIAAEASALGTIGVNSEPVGIGENLDDHSDFFAGQIDDVRIYARALSDSEIKQLYDFEMPCTPHAAKATATVVNGFVVGVVLTDNGCGYTNAPKVEIIGGGGIGATAIATVTNGIVSSVTVTGAGSGYTTTPIVIIGSPPFAPWLSVTVSKVNVTAHVVLGHSYILLSSTDMANWTQLGSQFTAQSEVITQEFPVDTTGRYFRILEVP